MALLLQKRMERGGSAAEVFGVFAGLGGEFVPWLGCDGVGADLVLIQRSDFLPVASVFRTVHAGVSVDFADDSASVALQAEIGRNADT